MFSAGRTFECGAGCRRELHIWATFEQQIWRICCSNNRLINTKAKLKPASSWNSQRAPWVREINGGSKANLSPQWDWVWLCRSRHLSIILLLLKGEQPWLGPRCWTNSKAIYILKTRHRCSLVWRNVLNLRRFCPAAGLQPRQLPVRQASVCPCLCLKWLISDPACLSYWYIRNLSVCLSAKRKDNQRKQGNATSTRVCSQSLTIGLVNCLRNHIHGSERVVCVCLLSLWAAWFESDNLHRPPHCLTSKSRTSTKCCAAAGKWMRSDISCLIGTITMLGSCALDLLADMFDNSDEKEQ